MSQFTRAQEISLAITPMATGTLSLLGSSIIVASILRSSVKLRTVYRRIIFGICVFDIVSSLGNALSTVLMPVETGIWGAVGNDATCGLQTFTTILGVNGSVCYSLSLSVYFLLVVRYGWTEVKIKRYTEPLFHIIPIIYSFAISIFIVTTKNYNPSGVVCWVEDDPVGCQDDPEVECKSFGNIIIVKYFAAAAPLLVFFLSSVILTVLWCTLRKQIRMGQAKRYSWALSPNSADQSNSHEDQIEDIENSRLSRCYHSYIACISAFMKNSRDSNQCASSPLADHLSRPSRSQIERLREVTHRGIAYIIGYQLTYGFSGIYRIIDTYAPYPPPFAIIFLSRFFIPLQGLFNVFIYTHSHVTSYRRNHSGVSWLKGLWEVIKSGGDSDQLRTRANRRESLRKQQLVLAQSEMKNQKSALGDKFDGKMNTSSEITHDIVIDLSSMRFSDEVQEWDDEEMHESVRDRNNIK